MTAPARDVLHLATEPDDPLHSPAWREAAREYHANRPTPPSHEESAARWADAQVNAVRILSGRPPEWDKPPAATIEAARHVARTGDAERMARFLAGRAKTEIDAIHHALAEEAS